MLSIWNSLKFCHVAKLVTNNYPASLNPFPNKAWFLCVCSTSLLKTILGKGDIARDEQFLLFPWCFYCFFSV